MHDKEISASIENENLMDTLIESPSFSSNLKNLVKKKFYLYFLSF